MEYKDLEITLRAEAETVRAKNEDWSAGDVSRRLVEIADALAAIKRQHSGAVDASMGKRSGSGSKLEI